MRLLRCLPVLFCVLPLCAADTLPPDIDKVSLSRLPILTRADMKDDYERKIYDTVYGDRKEPLLGPGGVSLYSPHLAESMDVFNKHLRFQNVVGRPLTEVAILTTARELDAAYEWNSHENTARMIGVDPKVIDVIKNSKDTKALPEKERMIVDWGRALLRDHRVPPELYARMVTMFGKNGMYEVTSVMSDYLFAAILLHAVDQHKLPDAKYDLPKRAITKPRPIAPMVAVRSGGMPADIDKDSLSRLPLLTCSTFTGHDQEICKRVAGPNRDTPPVGPGAISVYSIPVADAMDLMNQYLGRKSAIGGRAFQLGSLVGSREYDQQYEWTSHEAAAVRLGVAQSTVDIIKFNKPIEGISDPKDDAIVRAGRQLFQQHHLDSPAGWAALVTQFGKQGALDVVASMADYAMVGLMMNAVDIQLQADRAWGMPLRQ